MLASPDESSLFVFTSTSLSCFDRNKNSHETPANKRILRCERKLCGTFPSIIFQPLFEWSRCRCRGASRKSLICKIELSRSWSCETEREKESWQIAGELKLARELIKNSIETSIDWPHASKLPLFCRLFWLRSEWSNKAFTADEVVDPTNISLALESRVWWVILVTKLRHFLAKMNFKWNDLFQLNRRANINRRDCCSPSRSYWIYDL